MKKCKFCNGTGMALKSAPKSSPFEKKRKLYIDNLFATDIKDKCRHCFGKGWK